MAKDITSAAPLEALVEAETRIAFVTDRASVDNARIIAFSRELLESVRRTLKAKEGISIPGSGDERCPLSLNNLEGPGVLRFIQETIRAVLAGKLDENRPSVPAVPEGCVPVELTGFIAGGFKVRGTNGARGRTMTVFAERTAGFTAGQNLVVRPTAEKDEFGHAIAELVQ